MEQRNLLLDVMRGIAIILVVLGHAGVVSLVWNFIYSFHMPLFFFISGYFCKTEMNCSVFLIKKLKSLYLPFLKSYLLFIVLSPLLHNFGLTKCNYDTLEGVTKACLLAVRFRVGAIDLLGQFWFLPVLFFVSIITFFLMRFSRKYISGNRLFCLMGG